VIQLNYKILFQTSLCLNLLCFFLNITNEMQSYTILFITVNTVHVSGGFYAHHQELKNLNTASGICQACLLLVCVGEVELTHASGSSNQADDGRRNRLKHVEH
jgi:hypothetical protein